MNGSIYGEGSWTQADKGPPLATWLFGLVCYCVVIGVGGGNCFGVQDNLGSTFCVPFFLWNILE